MLREIAGRGTQTISRSFEQQYKVRLIPAKPEDVVRARKLMDGYWDEWAKQGGPKTVEALAQVKKVLGR